MTEEEWWSCKEPKKLLHAVKFRTWRRPSRLFAVGCGRLLWPRLVDERSRRAVEVAERHADGAATDAELAKAHDAALAAYRAVFKVVGKLGSSMDWAAAACADPNPFRAATAASSASRGCRCTRVGDNEGQVVPCRLNRRTGLSRLWGRYDVVPVAEPEPSGAGWIQQAEFVRCIYPFGGRPVRFDPSHRTEAAIVLARSMYESRDFSAAPALADTLEDAGCSDAQVLSHLRGGGTHVRGCWCVDEVLGRS